MLGMRAEMEAGSHPYRKKIPVLDQALRIEAWWFQAAPATVSFNDYNNQNAGKDRRLTA